MFVSRPYQPADLETLWHFTSKHGKMLPGDLVWRVLQHVTYRPERDLWIWGQDGAIVGFCLQKGSDFDYELSRDLSLEGRSALLERIVRHAENHARETGSEVARLVTSIPQGATEEREVLERLGFQQDDYESFGLEYDLSQPIPEPKLPEGFTVRHVQDDELGERVDLHREVWHPSRVTLEAHRNLRAFPQFRPELDIVAVSPEGRFASYCIVWYDAENKVGEFEPVGTRPAFERKGLGKAVLWEGLRRLKKLGAERAVVYSLEKTLAFYRRAGFQEFDLWLGFAKPLQEPS